MYFTCDRKCKADVSFFSCARNKIMWLIWFYTKLRERKRSQRPHGQINTGKTKSCRKTLLSRSLELHYPIAYLSLKSRNLRRLARERESSILCFCIICMVNFTCRRSANGNDVNSTYTPSERAIAYAQEHEYHEYPWVPPLSIIIIAIIVTLYVIVFVDRRWQLKMFDSILYSFSFSAIPHTQSSYYGIVMIFSTKIPTKTTKAPTESVQRDKAFIRFAQWHFKPSEYIAF